uniref:Uncharacterized protein n=1 Tax=Glossina brevipalpis TaxID=37001 RepID=A0A1A9X4B1_9MUSC
MKRWGQGCFVLGLYLCLGYHIEGLYRIENVSKQCKIICYQKTYVILAGLLALPIFIGNSFQRQPKPYQYSIFFWEFAKHTSLDVKYSSVSSEKHCNSKYPCDFKERFHYEENQATTNLNHRNGKIIKVQVRSKQN